MRIPFPYIQTKKIFNKSKVITGFCIVSEFLFILVLCLSITIGTFAQEDDTDFLDKVLEEKPKKADHKKLSPVQSPNSKDKKKKLGKNAKKNSKKQSEQSKKNKPSNNSEAVNNSNPVSPQNNNHKLNLEYWIHEELIMSPRNIPGFEETKVENQAIPPQINPISEKPNDKKITDTKIQKDSKPNVFLSFLNEYKKIIFIFAAIIIFAIYRLRFAGARNYDNSGRIFSKFRNK